MLRFIIHFHDLVLESSSFVCIIQKPGGVPIILVGNKVDLTEERQVTIEQGQTIGNKHHAAFLEASAKLRINIDEQFLTAVREYRRWVSTTGEKRKGKGAKNEKKKCVLL